MLPLRHGLVTDQLQAHVDSAAACAKHAAEQRLEPVVTELLPDDPILANAMRDGLVQAALGGAYIIESAKTLKSMTAEDAEKALDERLQLLAAGIRHLVGRKS